MAGTVTVTEETIGNVHKIKWTWISTAGGAADLVTTKAYGGIVRNLRTVPAGGGSAPTDDYDITITDPDGLDVMLGAGANRDTAVTENAVPGSTSTAHGKLTLNVTNAGATKGGTATLYIQGGQG